MSLAITTKYLGPTERRGSRVRASTANGHTATVSVDDALNTEGKHFEAVKALCAKHNWDGHLMCGGIPKGLVWVWSDGYNAWKVPK